MPTRPDSDPALSEGLRLVREQFEQVLRGYGLEHIDAEGEPFDPALHDAVGVAEVPSEDDDGRVMREWQAGYRFGERVLRAHVPVRRRSRLSVSAMSRSV